MGSENRYENTPNKEFIDPWLEKMKARYQFDKLKQMSINRLQGMEFRVDSKFLIFKAGFPDSQSAMQGLARAWAYDDPKNTKEALTPIENERLREAKSDIKHEIYRAQGYREKIVREHRSDLLNALVDLMNGVSRSILGIWATVKEITPW